MYCQKCGALLKTGASFCGSCGAPAPKPSQYTEAPSQYTAEPSQYSTPPVQSAYQPAPRPVKKKKTVLPVVVIVLVVLSCIVRGISSNLEPPQVEIPEVAAPSPIVFPSPLNIEDTQTEPPQQTPQAQEPVTIPETVPETVPEVIPEVVLPSPVAVAPPVEATDGTSGKLCSGVWIMYSPQTADAEEYVFYGDGTVDCYYRSVMDGSGDSQFSGCGSYRMEGQEIVVSVAGSTFTCWFEGGDDRLWFETYNGAGMTPIRCYLQNYSASPGLSTLQTDGNAFRQYIQNQ